MTAVVAKSAWEGKIPTCFKVARYEIESNDIPGPFYAMLPRNSYLTLLTKTLTDAFHSYIDEDKTDEVWFEYRERPLRWHYPCGLLYDLFCDTSGSDLPWQITVHFQNFPEDKLIRCPNEDAIESHFISVLKEADHLKHRGQVISDMSKNQHQQLWHGLKTNNFDEFWQINRKFMLGFEESSQFKNIPIRLYYKEQVLQHLVTARTEDDLQECTLFDILNMLLPELFDNEAINDSINVIIQGICPPLSASIQWLSVNLSYADNFLHICVHSP